MDNIGIKISSAILDEQINASIKEQLTEIKNLSVNVNSITLNDNAIKNIKDSLAKNKIDLQLNLGNTANIQSQAKIVGQQVGDIISATTQKAISNVSSKVVGEGFKVSPKMSNKVQTELESLVKGWTSGKGAVTSIKIDTKTNFDKGTLENIEALKSATVQYSNELGEVITKTLHWKQISETKNADGSVDALKGWVESASTYKKAIQEASVVTDNFVNKQKQTVSSLQNTLNQISTSALDSNAARPITSDLRIDVVKTQVDSVNQALNALGNANTSTFTDAKIKVDEEISSLRILIKEMQNASTTATSLKTKGIDVVKDETLQKVKGLNSDIRNAGVSSEELDNKLKEMNSILSKTDVDAGGINKVIDLYAVARAELSALKKEQSAMASGDKLNAKTSKLSSEMNSFAEANPSVKEFSTTIGQAEISVDSLLSSLSNVKNTSDVTVITEQFKAFQSAAKAAGLATKETTSDYDNLLAKANKAISTDSIAKDMAGITKKYNSLDAFRINPELSSEYNHLISLSNSLNASMSDKEKVKSITDLNTLLPKVKNQLSALTTEQGKFASTNDRIHFSNEMESWLSKNTNAAKMCGKQVQSLIEECKTCNSVRFNEIKSEFDSFTNQARTAGKLGKSVTQGIVEQAKKFGQWISITGVIMNVVSSVRKAATELKEVDTILTEISKTSDRTEKSLVALGESAVQTASKYGATISGYLKGVQEMSRAGFGEEQSEQLADLSSLTQSAGDMTADLANDYIIASDAAYGYSGNVEKLNMLLDGQNQVTNRNAVSMEELANATKVAANQLSNMDIAENELTALLGTGIATSRESGETVGRAVKAIMMNLQQVSGEVIEGDIIDVDSLRKVEERCRSVGVELEYVKDGMASLRDPMEILKELADVYNSLPEDSADRAGIISDIGGKHRGNVLSSILTNYEKYEKMLSDYENSEGSALSEAMKTAESWQGLLNQISNNWTGFIQNFAEDSLITNTLKFINELVKGVDTVTAKTGILIPMIVGVGITAFVKNLDCQKVHKNCLDFYNWSNIDEELIKWFIVQVYAFGSSKINQRGIIAGI